MSSNGVATVIKIADDEAPSRKPLALRFREDRISIDRSFNPKARVSCRQGNFEFRLSDVSTFGFRADLEDKTIAFMAAETVNVVLTVDGYEIFNGAAKVVNEIVKDGSISFGFAVTDGAIDKDKVVSTVNGVESRILISSTTKLVNSLNSISPEFKIATADLSALLKDLEQKFQREEQQLQASQMPNIQKKRVEETIIDMAVAIYSPILCQLFLKFEEIIKNFTADEHAIHKRYFRAVFSDLVAGTPFFKRAFEKPLGYAGDYGLMVMFYNYEDIGESLFHKFMHRWACSQPAALANKNRVQYLSSVLQDKLSGYSSDSNQFRVTSIACGPAQELALFLGQIENEKKTSIVINILDQEAKALEWATNNLRRLAKKNYDLKVNAFKEDAVLGSIKGRPFTEEIKNSDIIISAGLFDYLSDRVAMKLIESLYKYLKQGGTLIIGNVSTENPDKFAMDYLMEWNLILRGRNNLLNLVTEEIKKEAKNISVVSEGLGLNLFLIIEK